MAFGDFTVTRASTKLRIGSNGLYGSVANNVPAFEFNTDGTYRGLLVEPGATNLILRSQEFGTTWGTQGLGVTSNTTVAPDGATTGDTITGNGTQTTVYIEQAITFASAGTYTLSLFAKAGTHDIIRVNIANYVGSTSMVTGYNLTTGTTTQAGNPITAVGNGWYRIQFTFTIDAGDLIGSMRIFLSPSTGTTAWSSAGDSSTKSVVLWQAQLETGSVATSPIVTTAGTASRVIDLNKLASASSLIGGAGGLFVSWRNRNTGVARVLGTLWEDANNYIQLTLDTSNRLVGEVVAGGVSQATFTSSALVTGTQYGAVISFDTDSVFMCLNGAQVGTTDTTATIPTLSKVNLGHSLADADSANCHYKAFGILDSADTVANINELTTRLASL
jgi:hypothetical protein